MLAFNRNLLIETAEERITDSLLKQSFLYNFVLLYTQTQTGSSIEVFCKNINCGGFDAIKRIFCRQEVIDILIQNAIAEAENNPSFGLNEWNFYI